MLGGITPRFGEPLHCRVRYFDPERRRAGMPEDVASLVEKLTDDETTLSLVNINPVEERTVIVQGGAYAEHQLVSAAIDDKTLPIDRSAFTVRLAPGAGSRNRSQDETLCQPANACISLGQGLTACVQRPRITRLTHI